MEKHISELLSKNQQPPLTLKEVLETYSHIQLSEEETDEAILAGKRKKEKMIELEKINQKENENRQKLTAKTTYNIVNGLMRLRMEKIFSPSFMLDQYNEYLYEMLCHYFGEDPEFTKKSEFVSLAQAAGVVNPSLEKGIFLAGNFGVGKTAIMRLFSKNQRQCYEIKNAKDIAIEYKQGGENEMGKYVVKTKAAFEDPSVFYQKNIGICIDDLGTEDIKSNYGDKKNVIGDIIEQKYSQQTCGIFFHASTNLTAEQLKSYYGERVTSRMREIFNFIEVKGTDRRK